LRPSRHPRLALTALVIAALAAGWGIWHFSLARRRINGIRNVVLVSIDTCRADHLSCYGYPRQTTPNIDALAQDGVLFKSAFTPVPMTLPAHTSMLTGTYPPIHGVRLNDGYRVSTSNVTLAKIMQAAGYQTAAFIGGFPLDSRFGINQGFQTYDDNFPGGREIDSENRRKAEEVDRPAMTWLEKHSGKPFFLFLHYYDAHFPYALEPPFASTYADDPYAGEIAYVDRCIGQVLDKLRALGLYDNTLVIVTGDHGEGLGEHRERAHGFLIYQSTLDVPLIVRAPRGGVRGSQVNEHVSLVDIVPTVLGLIGLSTPPQVQGVDLRGYLEGTSASKRQEPIYGESLWPNWFGCSPLYGIVDGAWKYIRSPKPELYDLSRDRGEKANVVDKEPQVADRLRVRLEESLKAMASAADRRGNVSLDKEAMRRLESLGYVGGGVVQGDPSSDLKLEDAKDFLPVFQHFQTINTSFLEKRYPEAKKGCLEFVSLHPKIFIPYVWLGVIALDEHRAADAVRHFSTAMSILTESKDTAARSPLGAEANDYWVVRCLVDIGSALMEEGKLDQAIVELKRALGIDPECFGVHNNLGLALERQGKLDEAIAHYRKALKIEPDNVAVCYSLGLALARRGQFDEAITHYRNALAHQPDMVAAHNDLGAALAGRGQFDEAIVHYRKALASQPQYAPAQNNLAWLLATCPDASLRNGAEAVELAQRVVRLSGRRDPASLDTLAAAYAEARQFPNAVAAAQEAVTLARAAKRASLADGIQSHLDLYRAGRPYREALPKTSLAPVSH
jgi:arylsulfatase A-like enzyme/Flp pilus assembly protein TadD